jgi:hypothetical protein
MATFMRKGGNFGCEYAIIDKEGQINLLLKRRNPLLDHPSELTQGFHIARFLRGAIPFLGLGQGPLDRLFFPVATEINGCRGLSICNYSAKYTCARPGGGKETTLRASIRDSLFHFPNHDD